jgi:hypothetical protein
MPTTSARLRRPDPEAGKPSGAGQQVEAIEWIAILIDEFGFPPDYYERISWPAFQAFQRLAHKRRVEKLNASRRQERGLPPAPPRGSTEVGPQDAPPA